jgi:hypothetical protein
VSRFRRAAPDLLLMPGRFLPRSGQRGLHGPWTVVARTRRTSYTPLLRCALAGKSSEIAPAYDLMHTRKRLTPFVASFADMITGCLAPDLRVDRCRPPTNGIRLKRHSNDSRSVYVHRFVRQYLGTRCLGRYVSRISAEGNVRLASEQPLTASCFILSLAARSSPYGPGPNRRV